MTNKQIDTVEQDERGAFEAWARDEGMDLERGIIGAGAYNDSSTQACWRGWKHRARAASTSANVAQLDMSLEARLADAEADVKRLHAEKMELWNQVHGYAASVAQGAEAVATVKVYETYTGQDGWIEVTQEEYDRTKDKYEHRILRVPAPPAQTALTDDARKRAAKAIVETYLGFPAPDREPCELDLKAADAAYAALTAAQSASGDTK